MSQDAMKPLRCLEDLLCGEMRSRALIVAHRLGIFRSLGERPRSAADLQQDLGLSNLVALRKLLDVLRSLDLIVEEEGGYRPTAAAAPMVDSAHPAYFGHFVDFFAEQYRAKTADLLTEHIRDGVRLHRPPAASAWQTYMQAMEGMALMSAEPIARALELHDARRLLDLGGGPGTYATAFCRVYPDIQVTIRDLEESLAFARERVDLERIDLVPGSFTDADLGGPFDVIFVSHTIHLFDMAAVKRMLQAARGSLEPNGCLVIRDVFMDETGLDPLFGRLVALNMWGDGAVYSYQAIEEALRDCGYGTTCRVSFCSPSDAPAALGSLVVARVGEACPGREARAGPGS